MVIRCTHAGLRQLIRHGNTRRLPPEELPKILRVMARLEQASEPRHMNLPGLRLHRLSGNLGGFWSVCVSANRRIIFRFDNGDVTDVDLIDYH